MKDNFFRNKQILTAIGKVVLNEAQGQHAEIDEDAFGKLLNKVIDELKKEYPEGKEVYVDYRDMDYFEDNNEFLKTIQDSDYPLEAFDEYMFEAFRETEEEYNWDTIRDVYNKMREEDDNLPDWQNLDYDLQNMVQDAVHEQIPAYTDTNVIAKHIDVNVDICDGSETIYDIDDIIEFDDDGKAVKVISKSVKNLLSLCGKSDVAFCEYINSEERDNNDKFFRQLAEEIEDLQRNGSYELVFCVNVPLIDEIDLWDPNKKSESNILIKRGTNFGFFDFAEGQGGVNCELPQDIKLPKKNVYIRFDQCLNGRNGVYGVDHTMGLVGSWWKEGVAKSTV